MNEYPSEAQWRAQIERRAKAIRQMEDSKAQEDVCRVEIKSRMAAYGITYRELGVELGVSKQCMFATLRENNRCRLRPEREEKIREALERILRKRHVRLGEALGEREHVSDKRVEIAAARVALEEAAEQGTTTTWETVKAKLGLGK